MSGGAFNYVQSKDVDDLFNCRGDLSDLASFLQKDAPDVALETEKLLAYIEHAERQIEARLDRLKPVWKALDYSMCGDSSHADYLEEIERYRNT